MEEEEEDGVIETMEKKMKIKMKRKKKKKKKIMETIMR